MSFRRVWSAAIAAPIVRDRKCRASFTARRLFSSTASAPPPLSQNKLAVTNDQIRSFRELGYLIIPNAVNTKLIDSLLPRFDGIWSGGFETGIYPDEWHWRAGMSYPHLTREICNIWKCDRLLASVICSSGIGQLACTLMGGTDTGGWSSVRLAQDDCWHKPPRGGSKITFHRDAPYISEQFRPYADNSVTVWLALDDVSSETGTLQYVPTSHLWPKHPPNVGPALTITGGTSFHAGGGGGTPPDYHAELLRVAADNGHTNSEAVLKSIVSVEVPRGSLAIHHGELWHGSGTNTSPDRVRRSIGIHLIRGDVQFKSDEPITYIYGRYKKYGSTRLDEQFFPILYGAGPKLNTPQRSAWLDSYCTDAIPAFR